MIRARFAPSPTGYLHLGGARTALFNWAFIAHCRAQQQPAEFLLRIEDTDVERSTQSAINAILQAMQWLGLSYDGEAVYQTDRLSRYRELAETMIAQGSAYRCYATQEELEAMRAAQKARGEKPRYDRRWRYATEKPPAKVPPVIRFANPDSGMVQWNDLIKGAIAIDNAELDDFVILRADGVPTYNFANVVDDSDYRITHVIRGDDHVNNTPKQINLYRALGLPLPQFAHLPMIHGDDGEKLSKRHGAVNVMEYRDQGILPQALTNYLARLGFSHGNDEIFSLDQLGQWFDWQHLQSSPARFDRQKLLWLNQHYLSHMDAEELIRLISQIDPQLPDDCAKKINIHAWVMLYRERSTTLIELIGALRSALAHSFDYDEAQKKTLTDAHEILAQIQPRLIASTPLTWTAENFHNLFQEVLRASGKKMGQLGVPLRLALIGQSQSPSVDKLLACFDRDWALARLHDALALQ